MSECPEGLAKEFVNPPAALSLLPGARLYKLVSIPIHRQDILRSPWWIPESAFDGMRHQAKVERRSLSDVIRERLSIARRWNPGMDGLCILRLARKKEGWIGLAAPQPRFEENLIGGMDQICLLDLDWRDVLDTRFQVPFYQSGESRMQR